MSLLHLAVPAWELVVRSVLIYAALLAALRIFGKREVGQFTLYDLVLILLVANAVQPAMTGPDSSLLGGVIIIVTLVLLNYVVGRLDALSWLRGVFSSDPTLIIKDGQYLSSSMSRQGLNQAEVDSAIREHGLDSVSEVGLGVLEPDGSISVVGKGSKITRTKRRVRYRRRS